MSTKVTWLGHAALSLETGGFNILVDPFLSENPAASISPEKVNPDFILLSHGHGDHLGDTVPIAQRTGAVVITNAELSGWLDKQGIRSHGQHLGGGFHHPFGYLKLTLALHGSGLPDGSYGGNPAGFLLTTKDDQKIYMACDTGLFGDMRLIGNEGIDLAILPIGDNYTMGPDDALLAVKMLEPAQVIPIHYNTFEVIAQDPKLWAERVEKETATRVQLLSPGDSVTI
jgi:L-ascorbate metabolism protein UlaG (beta-lactamase superfamily)